MEKGWLCEKKQDGRMFYLTFEHRVFGWTPNPNHALRFARKEDGMRFRAVMSEIQEVNEHIWE